MTTDTCHTCGCGLIPDKRWRAMTPEARATAREYGARPKHRNGECRTCAQRAKRRGDGIRPPIDTTANRLEDVAWMADTGEHLDGAAARLGIRPDTLEAFLRRHDTALLGRLLARNPRDHNKQADGSMVTYLSGSARQHGYGGAA